MIEKHLSTGKANAKSRATLIIETGLSDRKVRREVENARERGVPVMPCYETGGYYLAANNEETLEYRHREKAKAKKIFEGAERNYVLFGQIGIASSWR